MAASKGNHSKIDEKELLFQNSFIFILNLIEYSELLEGNNKSTLANQLVSSGTAFGDAVNEARFTEMPQNDVSELTKKAKSVKYILQLCKYSFTYPNSNNLILDLDKLINQLSKIE